jgi:glycosyl transferase family 1
VRILLLAQHYPICSARYTADAFTRLGYDVRHIGPEMGRNIWGLDVAERYVWQADGDLNAYWPDWTPDLILLMDTALTGWRHPVYADVLMAVYTVDNHVRDVRQTGAERYFLAHKRVSITPWAEDCQWLPCAYDSRWHTSSPVAWEDRAYDVACLGVMYERRWRLVERLKRAGLKVMAGTGLVYDAYRQAHWNSRVALVSSFNGDVAQRFFETAAMGCLVVSDECPDFAELRPDGCLTYLSDEEAVEQIRWALAHVEKAKAHVEAAGRWVSGQTWEARAREIVEWFERSEYKAVSGEAELAFAQG